MSARGPQFDATVEVLADLVARIAQMAQTIADLETQNAQLQQALDVANLRSPPAPPA